MIVGMGVGFFPGCVRGLQARFRVFRSSQRAGSMSTPIPLHFQLVTASVKEVAWNPSIAAQCMLGMDDVVVSCCEIEVEVQRIGMTAPRKVSRQLLEKKPHVVWNEFVDILAMSEYAELSERQRQAHLVFWY